MDYKEARDILIKMVDKKSLNSEEKEAVLTAIGVLDWASLAKNAFKSRIKKIKAKKEKDLQV